ncbi:peptidase C39 family protein, partial [Fusicatenibacter saccharivorans]|nr:peptidase C39 family protein [Fusicatenibacter saccharivorans]
YERNNETETFVEEYPLKEEEEREIDLSDLSSASEVPLLLQLDQRWGYHRYAGEVMGFSGCGPTALSMVAIF